LTRLGHHCKSPLSPSEISPNRRMCFSPLRPKMKPSFEPQTILTARQEAGQKLPRSGENMNTLEKRIVLDDSTERVFQYASTPGTGEWPGLLEVRDVHRLIDGSWTLKPIDRR
jgi:hypothetical protein